MCCLSPIAVSALIGGAAGFLAASIMVPSSQDEAAEAGALASLLAGIAALTGFFFGRLQESLWIDFGFSLGRPSASFAELLQHAIDNEPMLLLQTAITILIGCVFLLTIVVATGAVVGFLRGRPRAAGAQALPGA
jgi:hypothetical protein